MIYSCTCFHNEFALLKIRCEELRSLDVIHVLVESAFTFSGKPKPLYFKERKDEFKAYPIIHIVLDDTPHDDPWVNEQRQRDACMSALHGCDDYDTIIISDVDECPKALSIDKYHPDSGVMALEQSLYYYYLNCLSSKKWNMSKILPWGLLKYSSPNTVRNLVVNSIIPDAGWHWSYQGGVNAMINKFKSFSHQEPEIQKMANEDILAKKLTSLESLFGNDSLCITSIIDLPSYVQTNQGEFNEMIKWN